MNAYNRIDDNPIINHETNMYPDYVLVIDPALAFTDILQKMISLQQSISLQSHEEG